MNHEHDYRSPAVAQARADLALALRAAAHFGLSEGVCNHFSVELPDGSGRFLLNPRGLLWSEVQADDIVMVDVQGQALAGRHPVESTAMHIHSGIHRLARQAVVLHTHMPYATALTLTQDRALDTTLSQNAMRFHGRLAVDAHYNGLALDALGGTGTDVRRDDAVRELGERVVGARRFFVEYVGAVAADLAGFQGGHARWIARDFFADHLLPVLLQRLL